MAIVGDAEPVEGPDLHGADALGQQLLGQRPGIGQEGGQVLEGARAITFAPALGPSVQWARAGVVDPDALVERATQELIYRLAARLAGEVPQRDIDGRQGTHLQAQAAEPGTVPVVEVEPVAFDAQGIAAQQPGRHPAVDVARDRLRGIPAIGMSDDPLVRAQAHKDQGRDVGQTDGIDADDAHDRPIR